MDIGSIFLIALGLAMDAFAVSITSGVIIKRHKLQKAFVFGFMFGGFQMLMPVLGWRVGQAFCFFISGIDHWIAFGLLFLIGSKMIWEAFQMEKIERTSSDMTFLVLLGLSIATSVDALAVGISFAFLQISILLPVLVIGVITFVMSFAGVVLGSRFGGGSEKKIEIVGGGVLIAIGFKILVSHLVSSGMGAGMP